MRTVFLAAAATVVFAANAFAQQTSTVGGIVQSIASDGKQITIAIGGDSQRTETYRITPRSRITVQAKSAKPADIKPGTRVTVSFNKLSKEVLTIKATQAETEKPAAPGNSKSDPPSAQSKKTSESNEGAPLPNLDTAAPKSPWTTNLAQMKIPEGRATGTILGRDFVVEQAKLDGGILKLRQGKDFFADVEVSVFLFLKEGENVAGKKYRVEARESFNSPHIHASARPKEEGGRGGSDQFLSKYAMILEFGKSSGGQLPGKIYLCLPDMAKSVVAGHFSVEVFDDTHPLATKSLISGKFTVRGNPADFDITLSCIGKNQEGKMESPGGGFELGGGPTSITSTTWAPRFTTVAWDDKTKTGSHSHQNRPPGHYLVFIRGNKQTAADGVLNYEGYYDWKWVELKDPDSKITVDLVVDPANAGTVEVTVAGDTQQKTVSYIPLDDSGELPLPEAAPWMQLSSSAQLDGGKAIIRFLRPGKYQIALGPWQSKTSAPSASAVVEVKRGETTKVELTAGAKK